MLHEFDVIFVVLFLTIASGFFSASESALFSLSSTKIQTYTTQKNPRFRLIAELVRHPRDLLVTVFLMNTLVNILLQNSVSHFAGNMASWAMKVGVPLFLTLVFGEIIPKYIGLINNVTFSYYVAPVIYFLQNLTAPLRKIIVAVTTPISRFMFFFLKKDSVITKEELEHVLHTSEEHGLLHPDEADLVQGYLRLQDAQVKELMRPREDILFYDINEPLSKLTYLCDELECTRVPMIDKNIDNIIGVVSAHHYFMQKHEIHKPEDLLKIAKKPFFIPESTPARILLRRFDERNDEMALVVDEYGSLSGLVTYEDLMEVVVGDIKDLRDKSATFTRAGKDVIIASGKMELAELEELFNTKFVSESNMVTIGGWLTEQIGDIPKAGTTYQTDEFLFQILGADAKRITRVYIRHREHPNGNRHKRNS